MLIPQPRSVVTRRERRSTGNALSRWDVNCCCALAGRPSFRYQLPPVGLAWLCADLAVDPQQSLRKSSSLRKAAREARTVFTELTRPECVGSRLTAMPTYVASWWRGRVFAGDGPDRRHSRVHHARGPGSLRPLARQVPTPGASKVPARRRRPGKARGTWQLIQPRPPACCQQACYWHRRGVACSAPSESSAITD